MVTVADIFICHTCRPCPETTASSNQPSFDENHSPMDAQCPSSWYLSTSRLHVQSELGSLRVHFVWISELRSDYSERPNSHPLSNRRLQRSWPWEQRQIAQSCAGDSQWDRSFDGLQSEPNPLALETQQPWKYPRDILSRPMLIQPNNTPSHILALRFCHGRHRGTDPAFPYHPSFPLALMG